MHFRHVLARNLKHAFDMDSVEDALRTPRRFDAFGGACGVTLESNTTSPLHRTQLLRKVYTQLILNSAVTQNIDLYQRIVSCGCTERPTIPKQWEPLLPGPHMQSSQKILKPQKPSAVLLATPRPTTGGRPYVEWQTLYIHILDPVEMQHQSPTPQRRKMLPFAHAPSDWYHLLGGGGNFIDLLTFRFTTNLCFKDVFSMQYPHL